MFFFRIIWLFLQNVPSIKKVNMPHYVAGDFIEFISIRLSTSC
jgi:hypothetical protein